MRHISATRQFGKIKTILALMLLVIIVVLTSSWQWWQNWQQAPVYRGEQPLLFEVPKGASMSQVAHDLGESSGYEYPRLLGWYAQQEGLAQKIQAGEYQIVDGTTPQEFLLLLTQGKVVSYPLTLIEGWTVQQMMDYINDHQAIQHTVSTIDQVMTELGFEGQHPEGRFFPDTYHVTKQQRDIDVLRLAYAKMASVLEESWQNRDKDIPLKSPYEALILASIIEKETGHPDEREQISGVFVRRLNIGMRLQTDPTVIYGVGEAYRGDITRAHLATDTPYNTYTRSGLPPTPIAMPGKEAIDAAVNPSPGTSLYFVATGNGDGRHKFSDNLAEHNRAVQEYLKRSR